MLASQVAEMMCRVLSERGFDCRLAGRDRDKVVLREMRDDKTRARVFRVCEEYGNRFAAIYSGWYLTLTFYDEAAS